MQGACGGTQLDKIASCKSNGKFRSNHEVRIVSTNRYWNLKEAVFRKTLLKARVWKLSTLRN